MKNNIFFINLFKAAIGLGALYVLHNLIGLSAEWSIFLITIFFVCIYEN